MAAPQWVRAPLRDPLPAAGDNELIVRKGHRSMSVLCDRIGKRVLFATPGKNKSVWPRFVAEMDRHNGPPPGDHESLHRHQAGLCRRGEE